MTDWGGKAQLEKKPVEFPFYISQLCAEWDNESKTAKTQRTIHLRRGPEKRPLGMWFLFLFFFLPETRPDPNWRSVLPRNGNQEKGSQLQGTVEDPSVFFSLAPLSAVQARLFRIAQLHRKLNLQENSICLATGHWERESGRGEGRRRELEKGILSQNISRPTQQLSLREQPSEVKQMLSEMQRRCKPLPSPRQFLSGSHERQIQI